MASSDSSSLAERAAAGPAPKAGEPSYHERLSAPWWAWPAAGAVGLVLAAELTMGAPQLRTPITYAVAVAVLLAAVWVVGRIRIAVDAAGLRVDDAFLPASAIVSVRPIDAAARRQLLGTASHPLAFVIQRPWIAGGVRVDLADPDDPTPYWFVSSRRPHELAAVITDVASARQ